jgi:hypothetical protein
MDLEASALELKRDPVGGYVSPSESNPSTVILYSLYHGKLYLVTVTVADVIIEQRGIFSGLIEANSIWAPDRVFFRVVPGQSIPAHPGCQCLKSWFDVDNDNPDPRFKIKPGRKFVMAFTASGTYLCFWPAKFTVVPGMYNEAWDDPNNADIKDPPAYELIPPEAK